MAPNLSGIKSTDTARVEQLVELAIDFAAQHLKPQGVLVAKVFHGMGYESLVEQFRGTFRVVKAFKPAASRDRSAETYLVGLGLSKP
jgi:23S rRNA (uridine2552-2'-O)-methyltransferase